MSRDTPLQRIKVAGRSFVLLPLEEYESLAKAAKVLSSSFADPKDAPEYGSGSVIKEDGESPMKAWRKQSGYTLDELGEIVGFKSSSLSLIETGQRGTSIKMWHKLAKALGTSIENIIPVER